MVGKKFQNCEETKEFIFEAKVSGDAPRNSRTRRRPRLKISPEKREIFSVKPYRIQSPNESPLHLPKIQSNQQEDFHH